MLTRLIVDLYAWIIEIALWLMLLIAAFAGFYGTIPMFMVAGWSIDNALVWKILGALFFPVAMFLVMILLTGPFLLLVDIRKSVRALEAANSGNDSGTVQPIAFREPHL